jgi:copper chaperone NosL
MNRVSTTLIWIAVVLFFGAYIFPLWSIDLAAPQYPEGMGMNIWINKVTGVKPHDLQNINGLNHYIGMKEIHAESIPELRFMKFIVAGLIFFGIMAGILRKRAVLVTWVVISIVVALVGLADFYKWGYEYGHDLDPEAPIKVPGMTYQPPLIGQKKLLNITATSLPAAGGIMLMLGVGLSVVALYVDVKRGRRLGKGPLSSAALPLRATTAVILGAVALSSCSTGPKPIRFGMDTCHYCMMTIANEQYGGEIVTDKGRVYMYDSVECMAAAILREKVDPKSVGMALTVDYNEPKRLVDVQGASFLHSSALRSPMGMNLTSFSGTSTAEEAHTRYGGKLMTWDEMMDFMKDNLSEESTL